MFLPTNRAEEGNNDLHHINKVKPECFVQEDVQNHIDG